MPDKIPLGKPLELTDKQLDELTTPEKMKEIKEKANKRWMKVVNPEIATVLNTTEVFE